MSDTKLKFLIYDETMSGNAKCQHQELQWLKWLSDTIRSKQHPNQDMTAQVPFIWDKEHKKQTVPSVHFTLLTNVWSFLQHKPNCWALNKQVEKSVVSPCRSVQG